MSKTLAKKNHQKRMVTTNRLLPLGGLRRQCIKKIFGGVVLDFIGQGRVLTKTLAKEVAHKLRRKFNLAVCEGADRNDEVNRIHVLLKGARKRKIGDQKPKLAMSGSSMDNLDTVPLLSEEQIAEIWEEPGGKIWLYITRIGFYLQSYLYRTIILIITALNPKPVCSHRCHIETQSLPVQFTSMCTLLARTMYLHQSPWKTTRYHGFDSWHRPHFFFEGDTRPSEVW